MNKKFFTILILLLALLAFVSGCSKDSSQQIAEVENILKEIHPNSQKLEVYDNIYNFNDDSFVANYYLLENDVLYEKILIYDEKIKLYGDFDLGIENYYLPLIKSGRFHERQVSFRCYDENLKPQKYEYVYDEDIKVQGYNYMYDVEYGYKEKNKEPVYRKIKSSQFGNESELKETNKILIEDLIMAVPHYEELAKEYAKEHSRKYVSGMRESMGQDYYGDEYSDSSYSFSDYVYDEFWDEVRAPWVSVAHDGLYAVSLDPTTIEYDTEIAGREDHKIWKVMVLVACHDEKLKLESEVLYDFTTGEDVTLSITAYDNKGNYINTERNQSPRFNKVPKGSFSEGCYRYLAKNGYKYQYDKSQK